MPNDPQVPWTDEQWACVNQVIQEEAKRARIAATFLPLYGPLPADSDYVRDQPITYPPMAMMGFPIPGREQLNIGDRDTIRLATLQVTVPVRNAQMADPELSSALALFRRAANVVARLEDAVVFRGLAQSQAARVALGDYQPPGGLGGLPDIWQITGASAAEGLWSTTAPRQWLPVPAPQGEQLVAAISGAIGLLEQSGHFGPFAVVLGQDLFLIAQTPDRSSLVLPQDRIIPFLGGGPLLRSSTLDQFGGGVVVALGGAPVELVVATDVCLQFLQVSLDPAFFFRVSEKIALRIREPDAIVQLYTP
jgi:uncharacterized linocin/CFP29 family protein